MKTKSYFLPLSLSLSLSLLLIGSFTKLNAQTVRVPTGAVGNSNNGNMGVGITTPAAKLDVQTDPATGAVLIRTAAGEFFGGYQTTPYALEVQHTQPDINNAPQTTTTVRLLPSGVLTLGNIASFNPTRVLNLPAAGMGVYSSADNRLTLTYGSAPGLPTGPTLNWTGSGQNFAITYSGQKALQITPSKQVLIGTDLAPGDYKLYIGGKAIAEEVVVKLQTNWPDYVFAPNYAMLSNAQLRQYIAQNGKLPYLPSAAEVAENGVALGETQTQLTRLVEELTLRLLEMEERVQELESQLAKQ